VVDVVGEPHLDAALRGTEERVPDDLCRRRGQADVVEREVERALGGVEEVGDGAGDLVGGLAAVR
jgi:hypothetical protein